MSDANDFDFAETAARVQGVTGWRDEVCERYTRDLWALGLAEDEVVECANVGVPVEEVVTLWNSRDRPLGDLVALYEGTFLSATHRLSSALRLLGLSVVERASRLVGK